MSRACGTVTIAKIIALQSTRTFGSYPGFEATPALVRGAETVALRKGQEAELGIAELKVLGFWFGSGASTSEGEHMLDVLEMKPGRLA